MQGSRPWALGGQGSWRSASYAWSRGASRSRAGPAGAGRRAAVLVEQDRNGEAVRTQDEPGDR